MNEKNSHGAQHLLPTGNLTTKLWGCLFSSVIMNDKLFEYLKLVQLTIVMVLGSVEDKKT
jgi:hypothetical protein